MKVPPVRLLVPGNIRHNSGGNVYNARLVEGLRALGADVVTVPVEGWWPAASARERRRFGDLLTACFQEHGPAEAVVIVDGLVAVGAPDELELAATAGQPPWILAHMAVPDDADTAPENPNALTRANEARAFQAAAGVMCTSNTVARTLRARHGLPRLHVALPGTEPVPLVPGSSPPHIIMVAALLPNKDQLLVVEALARIQDLDWTAALVGSDQADPEYAEQVRAAVEEHGLAGRIQVTGERSGAALEAEWSRTNLSLLVSMAEAFGMAVTESLARGIPVIVRAGTGAVEALHTGAGAAAVLPGAAAVLPGAVESLPAGTAESAGKLAAVLRQWLEDPLLQDLWRKAALEARKRLPDWRQTALTVLNAVRR